MAFVRERNGYGRMMILRKQCLRDTLALAGYAVGRRDHYDWELAWRP
jgi:hypothetical protein